MNIVFFSPTQENSAIAQTSQNVVDQLTIAGHQVVVVDSQVKNSLDKSLHFNCKSLTSHRNVAEVREMLEKADAICYQIGDNFDFHGGALAYLQDYPGLVILHDFFLPHLFHAWADCDLSRGRLIFAQFYSQLNFDTFMKEIRREEFLATHVEKYSVAGWIASMASSVITHSEWGLSSFKDFSAGPIRIIPLSPSQKLLAQTFIPAERSDEFVVLTVGNVNYNKRASQIVRAISSNPSLVENTIYRIVGSINPTIANELNRLASELGVRIEITGEVTDADLHYYLSRASVVTCLRFPALESSSASLIEALFSEKATIVVDTGCYREIPDDCVVKIDIENEIEEICESLTRLLNDVKLRASIAKKGHDWARLNYDVRKYVGAVESALAEEVQNRYQANLSMEVAAQLVEWFPKSIPNVVLDRLGMRINGIFE